MKQLSVLNKRWPPDWTTDWEPVMTVLLTGPILSFLKLAGDWKDLQIRIWCKCSLTDNSFRMKCSNILPLSLSFSLWSPAEARESEQKSPRGIRSRCWTRPRSCHPPTASNRFQGGAEEGGAREKEIENNVRYFVRRKMCPNRIKKFVFAILRKQSDNLATLHLNNWILNRCEEINCVGLSLNRRLLYRLFVNGLTWRSQIFNQSAEGTEDVRYCII